LYSQHVTKQFTPNSAIFLHQNPHDTVDGTVWRQGGNHIRTKNQLANQRACLSICSDDGNDDDDDDIIIIIISKSL
jgi:hypothetical protein